MKLKDLKLYLDSLPSEVLENEVVVPLYEPGAIATTPSMKVTGIYLGMDWDKGLAFIDLANKVTSITEEEVSAILTSVRQSQSYHAMKQVEELQQRIKSTCPHCGYILDIKKAQKEARQERQQARIRENSLGGKNG